MHPRRCYELKNELEKFFYGFLEKPTWNLPSHCDRGFVWYNMQQMQKHLEQHLVFREGFCKSHVEPFLYQILDAGVLSHKESPSTRHKTVAIC